MLQIRVNLAFWTSFSKLVAVSLHGCPKVTLPHDLLCKRFSTHMWTAFSCVDAFHGSNGLRLIDAKQMWPICHWLVQVSMSNDEL